MEAIYKNILNNVFGSNVDSISTMLKMLTISKSENYKFKVTLSYKDAGIPNCIAKNCVSKSIIDMFTTMPVTKVTSYDNIITSVFNIIRSNTMSFYHNVTENSSKCNIKIGHVRTPDVNFDTNCYVTAEVYKTVDTVLDDRFNYDTYERHIGEIYAFDDPQLNNWVINCHSVLRTNNWKSKKLHAHYTPYCCSNELYIEFKLKNLTSTIREDFLRLLDVIYQQDFTKYSLSYNIFHQFYSITPTSIPETSILTQSDIKFKANDCIFVKNNCSKTAIIIFYNNYIYMLTSNEYKVICHSDTLKDFDLINAFVCKFDDDVYYITDYIVAENQVLNEPYNTRLTMAKEFITTNELAKMLKINVCETVQFESWEDVNECVCDGTSLIYVSADFKKYYLIKSKIDIRIKFYTKRIPFTFKYCLYTVTNGSDVINSKIFYNNYSLHHLKYTIMPTHNDNTKYGLFDNPYFDTFMTDISLITDEMIDLTPFDECFKDELRVFIKDILAERITLDNKFIDHTIIYYKNRYFWIPLPTKDVTSTDTCNYKHALLMSSSLYSEINFKEPSQMVVKTDDFARIQRILNTYIVEQFITPFAHESVIDAFDGNDYFVTELYLIGYAKNIFTINNDKYNLINYTNTLLNEKNTVKLSSLLKTTQNDLFLPNINLKNMKYDLTDIKQNVLTTMLSNSNFATNTIDTFILSDNVNSVFANVLNLFRFTDLLMYSLKKDGRFILKYCEPRDRSDIEVSYKYVSQKMRTRDKDIDVIDGKIRYAGKVYTSKLEINDKYPVYAYVEYSLCKHLPKLPCEMMLAYKLCTMFGINVQYYASLFTRVLKEFIGITAFDSVCGGYREDFFMRTHKNKSVLVADNKLTDEVLKFIEERAKNHCTTLILTNDSRIKCADGVEHIQDFVYMVFPSNFSKSYVDILKNCNVLQLASAYTKYTPIKQIIQRILYKTNFKLDTITMPHNSDFFKNYIKMLNTSLTNDEIKHFQSITVASFQLKM